MPYSAKLTINCNLGCKYCYENVSRSENRHVGKQKGNEVSKLLETVKNTKMNSAPNLHGGEPLLLPIKRIEEILSSFYEQFYNPEQPDNNGVTSIQTNGSLITDEHIELFLKYKTDVGVSIDGHEDLNDGRWMGTIEKTRKNTERIIANIKKMKARGVRVSIIAVVNKHNGSRDKIEKLKDFLLMMKEIGILYGRLNMIELDYPELADELQMTMEEEIHFYKELAPWLIEQDLRYAPFTDAVDALLGMSHRTCVTTQCDPYHTLGELPIYMDGSIGNCLRTSKDGTVFLSEMNGSTKRVSNERYAILRQIPMSEGGCGGCKYWSVCNAHCPGSADEGDWRNKSQHCDSLYALFETTEKAYKKMMPSLRLTSENHGISDTEMLKRINDGTASELVFKNMLANNTNRGGKRGAF
jgi:uncharacterized protein